jgi:hypothetical protein
VVLEADPSWPASWPRAREGVSGGPSYTNQPARLDYRDKDLHGGVTAWLTRSSPGETWTDADLT